MILILIISTFISLCCSSSLHNLKLKKTNYSEISSHVDETHNGELLRSKTADIAENLNKFENYGTRNIPYFEQDIVYHSVPEDINSDIAPSDFLHSNLKEHGEKFNVNVVKDGHRSISYIIHPDNLLLNNQNLNLFSRTDDLGNRNSEKGINSSEIIPKLSPLKTHINDSISIDRHSHPGSTESVIKIPIYDDQFSNSSLPFPNGYQNSFTNLNDSDIELNSSQLKTYFDQTSKIFSKPIESLTDSELLEGSIENETSAYEDILNSSEENITYSYFIPKLNEDKHSGKLYDLKKNGSYKNTLIEDFFKSVDDLDPNASKLIFNTLIQPLFETDHNNENKFLESDNLESSSPSSVLIYFNDAQSLSRSPKTPYLVKSGNVVDVITAKPNLQNFEIVLESSFQHEPEIIQRPAKRLPMFHDTVSSREIPMRRKNLQLGLNMPPPEALAALPKGSVLIPPSQVIGKPYIPKLSSLPTSNQRISSQPLSDILSKFSLLGQNKDNQETETKDKFQSFQSLLSNLFKNFYKPAQALIKPPQPKPRISPPQKRFLYAPLNEEGIQNIQDQLPLHPPPPVYKTISHPYRGEETLVPPRSQKLNSHHDIFSGFQPLTYSQVTEQAKSKVKDDEIYIRHRPLQQNDNNEGSFLADSELKEMNTFYSDFYPSNYEEIRKSTYAQNDPDNIYKSKNELLQEKNATRTIEQINSDFNDYNDYEMLADSNESHLNDDEYSGNLEISKVIDIPSHNNSRPTFSDIISNETIKSEELPFQISDYPDDNHSDESIKMDDDNEFSVPLEIRNFAYLHNSYAYPYDEKDEIKTYINPLSVGDSHIIQSYSEDVPFINNSSENDIRSSPFDFVNLYNNFRNSDYPNILKDNKEQNIADIFSDELDISYSHDSGSVSTIDNSNFILNKTYGEWNNSENFNYDTQTTIVNNLDEKFTKQTSANPLNEKNIINALNGNPIDIPEGTIIPKEDFEKALDRQKYKNKFRRPVSEENLNNLFVSPSLVSENEASVANLWNDMKLIPLSEEDSSSEKDEYSLNFDMEFEKDLEEKTNSNRKKSAMAYILIGACVGLACLSIIGVFIIVRFKKTCGSREIGKISYFDKRGSIREFSPSSIQKDKAGHKLGSWFTGRNEQLGHGKLRSNMTLPDIRDKMTKSNSTRDLLSISPSLSENSTPKQSKKASNSCYSEKHLQKYEKEKRSFNSVHFSANRQGSSWLHEEFSPKSDALNGNRSSALLISKRIDNGSLNSYQTNENCEEIDRATVMTSKYSMDSDINDTDFVELDSKDIDDAKASTMSREFQSMSSQELGEELSRDLKNFHYKENISDSLIVREEQYPPIATSFSRDKTEVFLEFDNILRQHLNSRKMPAQSDSTLENSHSDSQNSVAKIQATVPPPRPPKPSRFTSSSKFNPNNGRARAQTPTLTEDSQSWTSIDEDRLI